MCDMHQCKGNDANQPMWTSRGVSSMLCKNDTKCSRTAYITSTVCHLPGTNQPAHIWIRNMAYPRVGQQLFGGHHSKLDGTYSHNCLIDIVRRKYRICITELEVVWKILIWVSFLFPAIINCSNVMHSFLGFGDVRLCGLHACYTNHTGVTQSQEHALQPDGLPVFLFPSSFTKEFNRAQGNDIDISDRLAARQSRTMKKYSFPSISNLGCSKTVLRYRYPRIVLSLIASQVRYLQHIF